MANIVQAEQQLCVFIRYNPDPYHLNGNLVKVALETREAALVVRVAHHLRTMPHWDDLNKTYEAEYLYYDQTAF